MKYISQLNKQKKVIIDYFDKKEIYGKRYRKGGWTGKEVLLHIKDSETVAYDRIRRIIAEERPILWYFEHDMWQKNLEYMKQDITLAKNVFLLTRESIIEAVEMHLKKHAKKEGIHSRRGVMSLNNQIEFLVWHADKHIKHLKRIKP
jgi:hypothetical protein